MPRFCLSTHKCFPISFDLLSGLKQLFVLKHNEYSVQSQFGRLEEETLSGRCPEILLLAPIGHFQVSLHSIRFCLMTQSGHGLPCFNTKTEVPKAAIFHFVFFSTKAVGRNT